MTGRGSKIAKFIINEVSPRTTSGVKPSTIFDPKWISVLVEAEMRGIIWRKQSREYLDFLVAKHNNPSTEPNDTVISVTYSLAKMVLDMK